MATLTVKSEVYKTTNRTRQLLTQSQVGTNVGPIIRQEGVLVLGNVIEVPHPFTFIHLMTTQPVQVEFNYVDPYDAPFGLWQTQCHRLLSGTLSARAVRLTGISSETKFDLLLANQPLATE